MGRHPNNENHVLVRLRRQISTPDQMVTREILARRINVSPSTIRDIETGKFEISEKMAQRLMNVTGVSIESLQKGEDPLENVAGQPLDPVISPLLVAGPINPWQGHAVYSMIEAAMLAINKVKRGPLFYELFKEFLVEVLEAAKATSVMKTILNRNLGSFDPREVPDALKPTGAEMAQRWEETRKELQRMVFEESEALIAAAKQRGEKDPVTTAHIDAYHNILDNGRLRDRMSKRRKPSA
jgi:transcriptional regulator with XRE-family HTH domain